MSGAENSLLEMLACLDVQRFEPIVALPSSGPLTTRLADLCIRTLPVPFMRFRKTMNPLTLIKYAWSIVRVVALLRQLIRSEAIDIVHSNSNTAHICGGIAARLTGTPSVWHSRDLVSLWPFGPILSSTATRIVAISTTVQQHLLNNGVTAHRLSTIHNCIDTTPYSHPTSEKSLKDELGVDDSAFLVAMVGQLVPWKNHSLFLAAANLMRRELRSAHFIIVGADIFSDNRDYVGSLESMINEYGLSDAVTLTGYRSDMPGILAQADLLIHPSVREPFGRVILEALAAETPVIAIDSCGPTEILSNGQCGILVPPDASRIAEAGLRIAQDPSLARRLASQGLAMVTDRFSPTSFAQKMTALYEEIL